MESLIVILVFAVTFVALIALYSYLSDYVNLQRRLQSMPKATLSTNRSTAQSFKRKSAEVMLSAANYIVTYLVAPRTGDAKDASKRLANAGYFSKRAPTIFLTIKFLSFVLSAIISITIFFSFAHFAEWSLSRKLFFVMLIVWIFYRLPDMILNNMIKKNQRQLQKELPDLLDLFIICVEAGYSNDKALERIQVDLEYVHPTISLQVAFLLNELKLLPSRLLAWNNFIDRAGSPEVRSIIQAIVQSEQLGAPLAEGLKSQINMLRITRISAMERKAMRLPVLLTIPMAVFIFPVLFIVVLGPAIINTVHALHGL